MNQTIEKLNKITHKQLINPKPIVILSYPLKFKILIRRILRKHKTININTLYWTTALLLLGLENYHKLYCKSLDIKLVERFTNKFMKQEKKGNKWLIDIDQAMNGYSLLYFKELLDSTFKDKMINDIYKFLMYELEKSTDGSIPYRQTQKELILIDTVGMVCPFLARYGSVYNDEKAFDMCKKQIINYLNNGIDNSIGLPSHGYYANSGEQVGAIGWGRGIGWLAIGIVDSLEYLNNDKDKDTIREFLVKFTKNVLQYQDSNGYIRSSLLLHDSEVDSSATAMIGYTLLRGIKLGLLDKSFINSIHLIYSALIKSMDSDGYIGNCQEDTLAVNNYAKCNGKYWAQGIGLAFFSLYEDLNNKGLLESDI